MIRWRQQVRGRWRRSWLYRRVLRHVSYELAVVGVALLVAVVLGFVSPNWVVADEVPVDFFATAAQINPVFIVAFAIELRMIDRLGMSEEGYTSAAAEALGNAVLANMYWEEEEPQVARELEAKADSRRDLRWVWNYTEDEINDEEFDLAPIARARYRARRAGQAFFAIAVIASVVGGQAAAIVGLSQDGAAPDAAIFRLTIAALGATTVMVVLGAMRDLLADVFGARRRG